VQSVTYEDDLDLLVVTFIQPCPDDEGYMGQVSLHDNETGALLKTISLTDKWDVVSSCIRRVSVHIRAPMKIEVCNFFGVPLQFYTHSLYTEIFKAIDV